MQLLGLQSIAFKLVISLVAGYAAYRGLPQFADIRITATTMVALSGTLTGFVMTAISMLVATADRPFMVKLRKTQHYQVLIKDGLTSAALWISVAVVALSGHILAGEAQVIAVSIAIGILSFSLMFFLEAGRKFGVTLLTLSKL